MKAYYLKVETISPGVDIMALFFDRASLKRGERGSGLYVSIKAQNKKSLSVKVSNLPSGGESWLFVQDPIGK